LALRFAGGSAAISAKRATPAHATTHAHPTAHHCTAHLALHLRTPLPLFPPRLWILAGHRINGSPHLSSRAHLHLAHLHAAAGRHISYCLPHAATLLPRGEDILSHNNLNHLRGLGIRAHAYLRFAHLHARSGGWLNWRSCGGRRLYAAPPARTSPICPPSHLTLFFPARTHTAFTTHLTWLAPFWRAIALPRCGAPPLRDYTLTAYTPYTFAGSSHPHRHFITTW